VNRMTYFGAPIDAKQSETITTYMSDHFGAK